MTAGHPAKRRTEFSIHFLHLGHRDPIASFSRGDADSKGMGQLKKCGMAG
jgi:hypothetical protein